MKTLFGLGLVVVLAGFGAAGCGGGGSDSKGDMATGPTLVCTPNEKACLTDRTAVVCTASGNALVPVQCATGQKCDAGECKSDPNAACSSAEDGCMNATTALRCSATSTGFDVVSCPTGTKCVEGGLCQGACVVGSSFCLDSGTLSTCVDGISYTATSCGATEACVATGSTPVGTAACKAAECQPATDGCDFVCGNKHNPSATGQDKTLSTCVETSGGYKWLAIQCDGVKTCNPAGRSCTGSTATQADCTQDCTPGDSRCADDISTQTCGTDGKWAAPVACNSNASAGSLACTQKPGTTNQVVCGDIACTAGSTGACDEAGKFHACGVDAKVATDGVACGSGVCVVTDNPSGIYSPGHCVAACQAGDERCVADSGQGPGYQTCVNGNWSAVAQCAGNVTCLNTFTLAGRPTKVCGECIDGQHTCNGAQIVTCTGNTWSDPADCTTGTCQEPSTNNAICVAECFPGKKVCTGNEVQVPGVGVTATTDEGACTAQGRFPTTTTDCTATGKYCRRGPGSNGAQGAVLGCMTCVGTANEFGIADTKCATDDGAGAGNFVTVCKPDSSGFDVANNVQCTGNNDQCYGPSTNVDIPPATNAYCHPGGFIFFTFPEYTQSAITKICSGPQPFCESGATCGTFGAGTATPCGSLDGGTTPDCCSDYCYADPSPTPAYCGPLQK